MQDRKDNVVGKEGNFELFTPKRYAPYVWVSQIEAARGSTHNANSRGESGNPCLVPLATEKEGERAKGDLT